MRVGTITFDLKFSKNSEFYQKKEKTILEKISPHLSQLNIAMAYGNLFRGNMQIYKLATNAKIQDHSFRCKLATFEIGKDCKIFICLHKTSNFTDL